jgi:hypothetical protein
MGGPEPCLIGDLKVPFYRALTTHVTSTHCTAIDEYAIVLRVDGSLVKFGDEGLARLRFAKARRYITIDIQIPETVWRPMSRSQTKQYLVNQVRSAIDMCVSRLIQVKVAVAEVLLWVQIEAAIEEYLTAEDSL